MKLEIESGHVKIASEQIEGEAIREADGTLEDGALVLRFADETETTEMRLMLLEDGTLQATTMMFDEELALFLEAV